MNREFDEVERTRLRRQDHKTRVAVQVPTVLLELIGDLADEHRNTIKPWNADRKAEKSWVVSALLFEALQARGLTFRDKNGRLVVPQRIDDLLA